MGSIDIHAHGFPESYLRRLAELYPSEVTLASHEGTLIARWSKAPLPKFDLSQRLAEMDRDDIALEILSAPMVYDKLDEHTGSMCRLLNDFQAETVQAAPDRFRSFLHLPVHDVAACRAELDRWDGALEVAGVILGSNMGGIYPGEQVLLPVWELIAERRMVVFIHPLGPCGVSMPVMSPILMFPTDTGVAATSIIYSGLLDRYPDLDIILSHYGGPLPVMAKRLDMAYHNRGFARNHGEQLPREPSSYLRRFYVDTAQGYHSPAFYAARAVFGLKHMLYGSDHFLMNSWWRAELNTFLDGLPLSVQERHDIRVGNAERLFQHFGRPPGESR